MEAVLSCLLLVVGWKVSRNQKFVNKGLILTYAPAEHATVIAIVVKAPLNFDGVARSICGDRGISPVRGWLIVVDAHPSIITARATSSNFSCGKVGPSRDWLKNSTLRA